MSILLVFFLPLSAFETCLCWQVHTLYCNADVPYIVPLWVNKQEVSGHTECLQQCSSSVRRDCLLSQQLSVLKQVIVSSKHTQPSVAQTQQPSGLSLAAVQDLITHSSTAGASTFRPPANIKKAPTQSHIINKALVANMNPENMTSASGW